MNLCVVCRDVGAPVASGLATATRDLADALAELGHDVHLVTDRSAARGALEHASLDPVAVPVASGAFRDAAPETARHNLLHAAAVYREVRRIHEREQPVDAVLAPLWRSEGAVCLLDDRFPTVISCVTSQQTLTEIDPLYSQLADIEQRLALERHAMAACRYLHGLTQAVLSKTIGDYGLSPDLHRVIGRGLWDRAAGNRPAGGNGANPVPRLLFVGRIERRKGVDTLLEAVLRLVRDGSELTLTLAGPLADLSFRERFEREAAADQRVAEAVRFAGQVSDRELTQLYAESDIVCAPARYESHGVVLLEAMMFGKAIVTCDSGGISEVVTAGRDALVCAAEDAPALAGNVRELLAEPDLRRRLGNAARATFEHRFDASAKAREMDSFLQDVLADHRSRAPAERGVHQRLAQLIHRVFEDRPEGAGSAAAELLDDAEGEPFRRLQAAARTSPMPKSPAHEGNGRFRVAAVVLTRDRSDQLERALDSLQGSDALLETLVIDNGSTPSHARRVAAICTGRDRVRLHRAETNLGVSAGRRLGIELTGGELLLFLDDDAELLPGALDHLLRELDSHPSAGAVTATVVSSDGTVMHSGGVVERNNGVVNFNLVGADGVFGSVELPPSGRAGWMPATAMLVRRALLDEFPFDDEMAAYFEDNEWSYRVSLDRPRSFRRSREALAFHRLSPAQLTNARRVALLGAATRFYQRHGVVLGPWLVDSVLPELRALDGTTDVASAKLAMELFAAKGSEWMLAAFDRGDFDALLRGHRSRVELAQARTEIERLMQAITAGEETMAYLHERHVTLLRMEQGGWWRLRGRILPLVRIAGAVRRRLRGGGHDEDR